MADLSFVISNNQILDENSKSIWESQTEQNYHTAANFYTQKKSAFLKYLSELKSKGSEEISNELGEIFANVWENGILKALEQGVNDFNVGAESAIKIAEEYNIDFDYAKLFQMYSGSKGKRANLGFEYEKIVAQLLNNYFFKSREQAGAIANSTANSLISQIPSGVDKSKSATTSSRGAFIRADLANVKLEKDDEGVSRIKGSGLAAELQSFIDINEMPPDTIPLELLPYLEQGGGAVGFSVKKMTELQGTKFSQSAPIAQKIQAGLTATLPSGKRRTWQQDWAEAYSNWCLSRVLFNILGPIDVALVSGNNFHWLGDFLGNNRFRMAIRRDGPEDSRGFAFRGLAGMSGLNAQGQPLKRKDEKGKIFIKGISQIH